VRGPGQLSLDAAHSQDVQQALALHQQTVGGARVGRVGPLAGVVVGDDGCGGKGGGVS
jgi:mannose/fructose/N-acetylgalactosamine-specific phosphotransferase system component IID